MFPASFLYFMLNHILLPDVDKVKRWGMVLAAALWF